MIPFKRVFSKLLGVLLLLAFVAIFLPLPQGQAAEVRDLKAYFDQLDARGGDWYRNYNNDSGFLAFREAYVLQSYLLMYERYKDTKYLDKFVLHADSVLNQRDSVRKVTDYRGLSLPAWRHTDPAGDSNPLILGGKYYHVAVDTGVISYPYAWFAQIIKSDPKLSAYNSKAGIYVQAAKDAIGVHEDEWRESGSSGCYIYRKGSPYWCDGVGVPFNQNLGLGRTILKIYQVTGETKYLDRATKIAQHFKNNLTLETDRYVWNYWWGYGYTGWTSSQQVSVNNPTHSGYKKFEDFRHGAVDGDFVALAHDAGIVFNDTDMQRFANTVGKNILRSDGVINEFVNSTPVNGSNDVLIGQWLRYGSMVPRLFDATYQRASGYTSVGAPGLLVVAYMNWAYGNTNGTGTPPATPPQDNTTPPQAGELITNGNFSQGKTGWSAGGTQSSESNGNSFMINDYNWQLYQDISLSAGSYSISASVKKATGTSARIAVFFIDSNGTRTLGKDIKYNAAGTGWESVPVQTFTVPSSAATTRIYLLSAQTGSTVAFDNISVKSGAASNPLPVQDTTAPQVSILQPAGGSILDLQTTLTANATDNVGVAGVNFEYAQNSEGPWTTIGSAENNTGNWTAAWDTQNLSDGTCYIRAIAFDAAGNNGYSAPIALRVDSTAPVIIGINASSGSFIPDGTSTVSVDYQLSEQAKITVTVTNGTTQVAVLEQDADKFSGSQRAVWDGKAGGSIVPAGDYYVQLTAVDSAGNKSAPSSAKITVLSDTMPPQVSMLQPAGGSVLELQTTLTANATDNVGVAGVDFEYAQNSEGPWTTIGSAVNGTGNWTAAWNTQNLSDGTCYIRAKAFDAAGNIGYSAPVALQVDRTAPVLSGITASSGSFIPDGTSAVSVDYQLSEQAKVTVTVNNGATQVAVLEQNADKPSGSQEVSWDGKAGGSIVPAGDYYVRITALDSAGNKSAPSSAKITVLAKILPPDTGELIVNGNFSQGAAGWSAGGTQASESSGNRFVTNVYNWQLYQDISLKPGSYSINASVKKGTGSSARVVVFFIDSKGARTLGKDISYTINGSSWENAPGQTFTVPAEAVATRVYLLSANAQTVCFDDISVKASSPETSQPANLINNGDFSQKSLGWSGGGTVKSEADGNTYISNGYNWQLYQDLNLAAGKQYKLNAQTRKGTSGAVEARIAIAFIDSSGNRTVAYDFKYKHQGTGWEAIPEQSITVPAGTVTTRIYLLSASTSGYHDFDNFTLQ